MKFRNDIQGLRALAVLFVFIFHLSNNYLPGGFIGVDMFFVISGYLISKIVASKIAKSNFNLLDFYIGRIKRIVPAYYFLLIAIWILFLFIYANSELGNFKLSHFWTILFNSNNHFAASDDYFGASSNENVFLHTWTLSVEMQFYLILPVVLLIIRKTKVLIIFLTILTSILLGYSTYEIVIGNKAIMYFSLVARSPEFFIGVIAAISKIEERSYVQNNTKYLSILGVVGLIVSGVILNESSNFPGITSLIPCLSTVLLLISSGSIVNKALSNKILVYVGEISYSIYLWHWPIMAFYRYHNERYEFTIIEAFYVILLTAIGTLVSYYLIEKPLRNKNELRFWMPFAFLVCTNILMVYFTVQAKNKTSDMPEQYIFPSFGRDSHGRGFKRVETLGDTSLNNKRILFLGDSHGLTFKPYLDEVGKQYQMSFRTITNDGYPAIPYIQDSVIKEPIRKYTYKMLLPHIKSEISKADAIIVYFAREGNRWRNAIRETLLSLRLDQKIIILSDYPTMDRNPVRTNKGIKRDPSRNNIYKLNFAKTDPVIMNLIENDTKASYIDMSPTHTFFKDAPFYKDTLIYYDDSHINNFGAIRYAQFSGDYFIQQLRSILNEK